MTRPWLVYPLGFISLATVAILYFAGADVPTSLSPQGCRMSWMSPSYVLHPALNRSWSPLADRYSLWLYREVGWESNELHGSPVLFIPGNAGSSHQVRSIASSAARQYFSSPFEVAPTFRYNGLTALDFFAVEFNEDLSAFHGTTLENQKLYTSRAIDYILSLYPANTSIIIMGHSMGGIVATSLLPHSHISAIITMSTPHTLPPARFDRRIDHIYDINRASLQSDMTPILSLCGGATDLMVPSESCILPQSQDSSREHLYRRTVFSSALEGSWTGVGHREMVWCHQVRWRVARAALELGAASSAAQRGVVLDTWLRDGHELPPGIPSFEHTLNLASENIEVLPPDFQLVIRNPPGSKTHLLPIPSSKSNPKFVLYVQGGSIPPTSPHNSLSLRVTPYLCSDAEAVSCSPLSPQVLKLLPAPIPGSPFPVPGEGTDESEGVVLFVGHVENVTGYVALRVEGGDGRGWVVGGFVEDEIVVNDAATKTPFISRVSTKLSRSSLRVQVTFPNFVSNALLVYRLDAKMAPDCSDALFPPLLEHSSASIETHYFPLSSHNRILLHSHTSAPYIPSHHTRGIDLIIHSSGECRVEELQIKVDWWGTIGRWGMRYWSAVASWGVAIVGWMGFWAWGELVAFGALPGVQISLSAFINERLLWFMGISTLISFLPLREDLWLGLSGDPVFVLLAPFLMFISTGFVVVLWWFLQLLMLPLNLISRCRGSRHRWDTPSIKRTSTRFNKLISMALVFGVIVFVVPWQVAFLGSWIYQLYICASIRPITPNASAPTIPNTPPAAQDSPIPLTLLNPDGETDTDESHSRSSTPPTIPDRRSSSPPIMAHNNRSAASDFETWRHANEYLLVLMTWLLPLVVPVLAVWVRTMAMVGFGVGKGGIDVGGDHQPGWVAPFLVLVEGMWASGVVRVRNRRTRGWWTSLPKWGLLFLTGLAFLVGPRRTYVVFECASGAMGAVVLLWGVPRWIQGKTRIRSAR